MCVARSKIGSTPCSAKKGPCTDRQHTSLRAAVQSADDLQVSTDRHSRRRFAYDPHEDILSEPLLFSVVISLPRARPRIAKPSSAACSTSCMTTPRTSSGHPRHSNAKSDSHSLRMPRVCRGDRVCGLRDAVDLAALTAGAQKKQRRETAPLFEWRSRCKIAVMTLSSDRRATYVAAFSVRRSRSF